MKRRIARKIIQKRKRNYQIGQVIKACSKILGCNAGFKLREAMRKTADATGIPLSHLIIGPSNIYKPIQADWKYFDLPINYT